MLIIHEVKIVIAAIALWEVLKPELKRLVRDVVKNMPKTKEARERELKQKAAYWRNMCTEISPVKYRAREQEGEMC